MIIDDADVGFSTSFSQDAWEEYTEVGGRHYGESHYYNPQIGTGQDIAMWSFTVPKRGRYEVYAWWWEASWRPTDVPYTINHLDGSTTLRVNQQADGGQWNLLGTFDFQDQGSVVVTDDASSGQDVVADAVRLVYLEQLPSATPTSTPTATPTWTVTATATSTPTAMPTLTCTPTANPNEVIIDDADARFSTSFFQDAWEEYTEVGGRHYGDSHHYNHQVGTGQDTAVWSFTVTVPKPGRYEVYAWWWEASWRPTDVPYTVNHQGGSTTVRVNQQTNGGQWNLLGTFDFQEQGSVLVSDDASSGQDAVADAVRFVYVEPSPSATATSTRTANPTLTPTPSPTLTPTPNPNEVIIDDPDARFSTSSSQDAWQEYREVGGRHYGDSHYYNRRIGTGQDMAVWSFTVPKPGRYKVYAWWWEASWRPTDVPYTINHRRGSTTVRVNQQTNGGQWNLLGTFHFLRQGSVVVSDDASSGQDVVADAIRLVRRTGPPAKSR